MKWMSKGFALVLFAASQGVLAASAERDVEFLLEGALALDGSNLEDYVEAPLNGINARYEGGGIGVEVSAGLALGPYAQLRVGHRRFGDQQVDAFDGNDLVGKVDAETSGNFFAADLMMPVIEAVSVGVTLGNLEWHSELRSRSNDGRMKVRESGSDLFAGVRGLVHVNDRVRISAFATRYDLDTSADDEDLEYGVLGVGLQARF